LGYPQRTLNLELQMAPQMRQGRAGRLVGYWSRPLPVPTSSPTVPSGLRAIDVLHFGPRGYRHAGRRSQTFV